MKKAIAAAALVASTLLPAGSARAASGDWGYASGNMRTCTKVVGSRPCPFVGNGWIQGWVRVWCWTDDGWFNGTNRWFSVTAQDGRSGYMNASVVSSQPSVPHC
jgi:hypothetical protein